MSAATKSQLLAVYGMPTGNGEVGLCLTGSQAGSLLCYTEELWGIARLSLYSCMACPSLRGPSMPKIWFRLKNRLRALGR